MANHEKKTGKLRFGILDVAIGLAIFACLCGVLLRYGIGGSLGGSDKLSDAKISFLVLDKNRDSVDGLTEGTEFYLKSDGSLIGTLDAGLSIMDAEVFFQDIDGTIEKTQSSDGHVDVRGTLSASGRYNPGEGFFLNGRTFMAAGGKVEVYTETCDFTLVVTGITVSAQ